jgi:uncharacterized protein with GYD domain
MTHRYDILMRWTEQGMRNFKDTIKRARKQQEVRQITVRRIYYYWTFGKYDGISILEIANDEAAMHFELKIGSLSNTRTTKLKDLRRRRFQASSISLAN